MAKTKREMKAVKYLWTLVALPILAYVSYLLFIPAMPSAAWESKNITIPKGAAVSAIARILSEAQLIDHPRTFVATVKILGLSRSLKAGRYRFPMPVSVFRAINILRQGAVAYHKVTIPEGLTMVRIAGLLQEQAGIDSAGFLDACRDPQRLARLGIPANNFEGYLYPDTYDFEWNTPPDRALEAMLKNFQSQFDSTWQAELKRQGLTRHQAVIMASLVEREAQVDSERVLVASVFYNRLRLRRPLESCASIEYILPKHKNTKLTYRDLQIDSPFNTYRRPGLPPGPISNPGRRSLEAAVFPAKTDYLYFVSRGDGGHIFSRTLQEHIRAKNLCERLKGR